MAIHTPPEGSHSTATHQLPRLDLVIGFDTEGRAHSITRAHP